MTPWTLRCLGSFVYSCNANGKQRGKRAEVLSQTRQRNNKPLLPTILFVNVQSVDNKLDELRAWIKHQKDIRNCCVLAFTETMLEPSIPDCAIMVDGFTVHRGDRTKESGMKRGGVCPIVNPCRLGMCVSKKCTALKPSSCGPSKLDLFTS